MFQYKCTNFSVKNMPALACINRHFVLSEVGTLVLKHDGNVPLTFAIIN
jgi:hypothetical protein